MATYYPPIGLHFLAVFELFPQSPLDVAFQKVSGLQLSVETDPYVELGENRFSHALPKQIKYNDLVLERGLTPASGVTSWARDAIDNFEFQPINVLVSLLNAQHLPLFSWYVVNAIPIGLEISGFDAMDGKSVVIETLTLKYQYFKKIGI